jgi:SRSO17 transposase
MLFDLTDLRLLVFVAELKSLTRAAERMRLSPAAATAELARLAAAIDDARQFALLAIDEARGETRAWKERCIAAEAQYKEHVSLTETFRRLAYRQGADIPPALERKTT